MPGFPSENTARTEARRGVKPGTRSAPLTVVHTSEELSGIRRREGSTEEEKEATGPDLQLTKM